MNDYKCVQLIDQHGKRYTPADVDAMSRQLATVFELIRMAALSAAKVLAAWCESLPAWLRTLDEPPAPKLHRRPTRNHPQRRHHRR